MLDYNAIWEAAKKMEQRTNSIEGKHHGSVYYGDKLIRYFEANPAAVSVVFSCKLNIPGIPGLPDGECEIFRDGRIITRRKMIQA